MRRHDEALSVSTNYRSGCRCPERCRPWRAAAAQREREARHAQGRPLLEGVIKAVESGASIEEAAAAAGLTAHQVWSKARPFPELRERLLAATPCQALAICGRPSGYRAGCRGPACRDGHAREFKRLRGTSEQPIDGDRLQCLECGKWFRELGRHLPWGHRMTAEEYRQRHGLPPRLRLSGEASREIRAAMVKGPGGEATRRGIEASLQRREAKREAAATAAGYASWDEMIVETAALTAVEVAVLAGVGRSQVSQYRRRLLPGFDYRSASTQKRRQERARRREARAHGAGYDSWEELIRETAHMSVRAAASRTGVSSATVARYRKVYGAAAG